MSKKNVDNEKLRNDIYENLPCQAMFNESVRKINNKNSSSATSATTNPINNRTKHTNLSTKELLYATPLRKSDRYKSGERSRFVAPAAVPIASNKISSNNIEYKLLNKEKVPMKNGTGNTNQDTLDSTTNNTQEFDDDDNELSTAVNIPNQQLEDRRILNFLKDTTQLPKKIEVGGKDCPNSSFSNLAREEHFANLVHQNFTSESRKSSNLYFDEVDKAVKEIDNLGAETEKGREKFKDELKNVNNLEEFMQKKNFPEKEVNQMVVVGPLNTRSIFINREWVLKKIALILEQRSTGKKSASSTSANAVGSTHSNYNGCLILGSNGSGKTSICQAIMNGNSGTKGILNRKLLACYLINSQNPNCHSLSLFLRSLILQILSHSSLINRDETTVPAPASDISHTKDNEPKEPSETESKLNEAIDKLKLFDDDNETIDDDEIDFNNLKTSTKKIIRQKSAPSPDQQHFVNDGEENLEFIKKSAENYNTHPPKTCNGVEMGGGRNGAECSGNKSASSNAVAKPSPGKKSKIPVPKGRKSSLPVGGAGESVEQSATSPTHSGNVLKNENEIEKENNNKEKDNVLAADAVGDETKQAENLEDKEEDVEVKEEQKQEEQQPQNPEKEDKEVEGKKETPLPKLKSCRTIIADSYYEILMTNPDILESLNVDNIERNPDECFKKIFLFPILEIQPPKQTLLILIDSIDENYINEGNLITTLKSSTNTGNSNSCSMSLKNQNQQLNKSRNVAELLSNHIHLLPKWLFLVCTTKKQTKPITKMFTGFKKITLDDLRKSHVVKDVQEYIINRLNCDFKGSINLTKEVIESLHQLYIKSNGCILYLEKVLNGIRSNFFTFREIKLIPCTLNGLYLYICQKSFNKKQYSKIRPILNVLLAATGGCVDKLFLFNCLRTHNYTIDMEEFEKRLVLMRNIITYSLVNGQPSIQLFHSSFADWLVDVKFATKKFICDVNEGHVIIAMYYTLVSESLCATTVRKFAYHLIKSGDYLANKKIHIDLMVLLLESRANLNDCLYTNHLNCCRQCEIEFKNDESFLPKTKTMIEKFLTNHLSDEFSQFLCEFFKPSLITDPKVLKLIIESGANAFNGGDNQTSCDSSILSPVDFSEKSPNIDFELADLLLSTEKSCYIETQRAKSPSEKSDIQTTKSLSSQVQTVLETPTNNDSTILAEYQEIGDSSGILAESTLHQLSDAHRIELHKGKALIHILANDGNSVLLDRALNACKGPVDLEIEDYNGQTALNIAARNGHLEVVKLLLSFSQTSNGYTKKVNINHADRDGWTALRSASWGGHTEVVKVLIGHSGIEIDLADKEGRTALRAAAWSGHEDILKILIEAGADVNSVDRQGRTSLIAASYMGHFEIVEILLENGADVNHLDLDGRSALCVAALCGSSGYSKVISTLLEHGANTDQVDNDGMSALLVSSFEGNDEVCELLLENGADPDLADIMGRTPLWAACTAGHANVVKLLLFWGCGIDCMDSEGRTVLSIAAAQGNIETIRQLLDRGLDETHRDNAGWTPLHYAAFEGFQDVCMQLIESGAKIDECDNEGKTALHLASQEGRHRCIEYLLGVHSIFVDQKAHDGKTSFRLAALEGHLDSVQILLKYGCDVNTKDADCRTTLYILALENKLDVVKYLLEVSNVDVNMPDSEGRTALHVAAWQGHVEMVKLLITLGNADVNSMDLECRTPLHSCAWQGNHDVMGILLYFGAVADHACKQGATALGISAQEGHEKCVSILLKYGANPYKSDHCGRTPIKLAAKSNRNNVLKIFETFTKNEASNNLDQKVHSNMIRSPDTNHQGFIPHQQPNLMLPNNHGVSGSANSILNASQSTHSSNNFYENTMRSDVSSVHKRKSVISSQSTGSSNDTPLTFAQQLQRHSRRNSGCSVGAPVSSKYNKAQNRHSQVLPDLNEDQFNMAKAISSNDADLFDLECMSPLYATPPHSPTSELGSPMQLPLNGFDDHRSHNTSGTSSNSKPDSHFARDTHMRIILGNLKEQNQSQSKPKRSGITTNPAMRLIKSRFDAASQLIRRTNNMLSNSGQGSSSIGVKSGTFQWRKEGHN